MKIINFFDKDKYSKKPKVLALGKFESIHIGHRKIFKKAKEEAKKNNYEFGIMIFNEKENNNIYLLKERISFLKEYEPDYIMIFEKNDKNFLIDKKSFNKFLLDINTKIIVVGNNFRYSRNKKGSNKTLKEFKLIVIDDVFINNKKVSTTLIINCIKNSDFVSFKKLTSHYFFYKGIVIKGKSNGKKLGTPTANVNYPINKIDINDGIYYSFLIFNGKRWASLTSISYNPTFNAKIKTYETYIFNFSQEIYGKEVHVEIIEKIRNPIKFDSVNKLIKQLDDDKNKGKVYFKL